MYRLVGARLSSTSRGSLKWREASVSVPPPTICGGSACATGARWFLFGTLLHSTRSPRRSCYPTLPFSSIVVTASALVCTELLPASLMICAVLHSERSRVDRFTSRQNIFCSLPNLFEDLSFMVRPPMSAELVGYSTDHLEQAFPSEGRNMRPSVSGVQSSSNLCRSGLREQNHSPRGRGRRSIRQNRTLTWAGVLIGV